MQSCVSFVFAVKFYGKGSAAAVPGVIGGRKDGIRNGNGDFSHIYGMSADDLFFWKIAAEAIEIHIKVDGKQCCRRSSASGVQHYRRQLRTVYSAEYRNGGGDGVGRRAGFRHAPGVFSFFYLMTREKKKKRFHSIKCEKIKS